MRHQKNINSKLSLLYLIAMLLVGLSLSGCAENNNFQTEIADKQTRYHWKLVTAWPKNLPAIGTAPEKLAKLLKKMSDGRLNIKVYSAGELVPALEVFDAVSHGAAEMGHAAAYYWRGKIPSTIFFSTVPFGLNAQELNAWIHHGGGLAHWRKLYEPYNLIPFLCGNTGVQMGGWFNKEIKSEQSIAGLKMRMPGIGGEVMQRLGAVIMTLPASELFIALDTGLIDATEWIGPYNDLILGFHQIAQYYYYPGWHEPGPALELTINKQAYESLPEDLQEMIEVAIRAVNQDVLDEFMAANANSFERMKETGVEFKPFPKTLLNRFEQLTNEILNEEADKDPVFKTILQDYRNFQSKISPWSEVSEKAILDMRKID